MIRILVFVLVILALGSGFAWLADRPGELSVIWMGMRIEMSLLVAATVLVALVALIFFAIWLVRTLMASPHTITRYFRARKRDRGYQALSTGLIAAGAGDATLARKMTVRARGLIRADQEPLIHLLEAQTALIEGRYDDARRKFEQMADDPETRELGLRGLYLEASRLGATEAARQYAERAAANAPHLAWAALATLDHKSQAGAWDEAVHLIDQIRAAHVIDRKEAERKKAVLLTARARARLEADPRGARDDAQTALKLSDGFVPAALLAAKAYLREDNLRKGAAILEKAWKQEAHPEIARLYVRARSGDSALDRLKRATKLETIRPNNPVSLLTTASAALDAREFATARAKAEAAARMAPSEEAFLLLADIEEAETGDVARIRHWMSQALKAPRDATWIADGVASGDWQPVSPVTGRLDAFEWKTPVLPAGGDVIDAEAAIRSLPPVKPAEKPMQPAAEPQKAPTTIIATPATSAAEKPAASAAEKPVAVKAAPAVPEPVAVVEKPAKVVPVKAATAPVAKPADTAKAPALAGEGELVDPFFGRPPDDPGVRDPQAEEKAATRLY
ncbi:HemY protein [Rhizobium sp. RU20A]|uniref:heme biosynthesis protein HemY n=1 Tax=Rhizobium sp. RU20A TaxID=1907412 RepID=UPI000955598C|nr:heme biosynthesis protein HemY [Rhizobium sp. RU20A]SIQ90157.1 HemY protein [Rhizobium sp. RU20A]